MRITHLTLEHFRNHASFDSPVDSRVLIIGPNGEGKSSLVDAIAWCLTGRCRGVNDKGEGQQDLITMGAAAMSVTVEIDGIGPITRTLDRKGSATVSMKNEAILARLGVDNRHLLMAVLYGRAFFDLHHADAKALLMQVLNVQIPAGDLPGVKLPKGTKTVTLTQLDDLYQAAFEDRKTKKAQLKNTMVPARPKVVSFDLKGKTLDALQAELADAQAALETAATGHAAAERAERDGQQAIADADAKATGLPAADAKLGAHQDMLAKHQKDQRDAEQALAAARSTTAEPVDALQIQSHELDILIEKLQRHSPDRGCVLSADIPCLTKGAAFAGQIKTLRDQVAQLGERVKAGQARAKAIGAAEQSVADALRHVTYHQNQIQDAEAAVAAGKAAKANLATLQAAQPNLRSAVTTSAAALTNARANATRLSALVAEAAQYQQAMTQFQQATEALDKLTKQVADAEAVVGLLGPTGVRVGALVTALAAFHEAINQELADFGFSITIQPDPWQVTVTGPGDGQTPIRFDMLSKGQQLWTGMGLQLALAGMSGLDFCVIDDAEAVVGQHRGLLTEAVLGSGVGQIIVAMAKPATDPVPQIDGLQVMLLLPLATAAA